MARFSRRFRRHGKVTHMRQIEFTQVEYRAFVWKAVNDLPSKDAAELAVQVEVNKKLKAVGHELPLSEQDQKAVAAGEVRYASFAIDGPEEVLLQDEEWRWLKDRLNKFIPFVSGYAGEDFKALLEKVEGADKVEVQAVQAQG